MKSPILTPILALPLVLTANAALADCASWSLGDLTVTKPWSRATMGAQRPGVFYVEIRNAGAAEDALTKIATPAAKTPMLHETVVKDGVASMIHADSVPIPAEGEAALAPGGRHGMLMGLSAALKEGESFPLTLSFAKAGDLEIQVEVARFNGMKPPCAAEK